MQVLSNIENSFGAGIYKGMPIMVEKEEQNKSELLYKAASGDVMAKLDLLKSHLSLIEDMVKDCISDCSMPLPQMLQIGTIAFIKALNKSNYSRYTEFLNNVRKEITNLMEDTFLKL
ncbi:MAG: hypothetical protein ACKD6O_08200 [Candidatus Bathyarchaeota archaeon]